MDEQMFRGGRRGGKLAPVRLWFLVRVGTDDRVWFTAEDLTTLEVPFTVLGFVRRV